MDLGKLLSIFINIYQINNWSIVYNPHQPQIYHDISDHKRSICSQLMISPRPFVKSPLWVPLNVAPAPAWTKPIALLQLPRAPHGTPGRSDRRSTRHDSLPIGSMYGIYANIGGILMVNVTIYGIHGSYGLWKPPIKDAENTFGNTFGPGKGVEHIIESYILETLSGIFLGVTGNWTQN